MLCISDFSTTTVATLPSSSKNRCPRGYNNGERVLSLCSRIIGMNHSGVYEVRGCFKLSLSILQIASPFLPPLITLKRRTEPFPIIPKRPLRYSSHVPPSSGIINRRQYLGSRKTHVPLPLSNLIYDHSSNFISRRGGIKIVEIVHEIDNIYVG